MAAKHFLKTKVRECYLPGCSVALSGLGLGMLWSSFHGRWKGVPLKPLSRVWKQRRHSDASAKETGCNVMLAENPDSCLDLKHNLFRAWTAPTVKNHRQRFEFQLLQDKCNVWKGGQNGVLLTKTFLGGKALHETQVLMGAKVKKQFSSRELCCRFYPKWLQRQYCAWC